MIRKQGENLFCRHYELSYLWCMKNKEIQPISIFEVEARVIELRGIRVILDSDIADLYGMDTKHINQAVNNNKEKFPEGYFFTLQNAEKEQLAKKYERFESIKNSTVEPIAFSERGLYMLATILKSRRAVQTTISIIDSFAKVRELSLNIMELHTERDNTKQKEIAQRTGELLSFLLVEDGETAETASSIGLNQMFLTFEHTIKRTKK